MRILLVTHYFEPDSGAAAVRLSRLAHILQERGHSITVLTTMPHYPVGRITAGYRGRFAVIEDRDGIRVIRTWLFATPSPRISRKFISQGSFMLTAALRGLGIPRPDVMLVEAQPVFTSLVGVFLSKLKRAPYVLNVSDLWPDHLLSVGALTENHPVYRAARRVVDATYRGAAGIAALSPGWAEKIAGYIGHRDTIRVIYNGVDLGRFHPDIDGTAFRRQHHLIDLNDSASVGVSYQHAPAKTITDGAPLLVTFIGTFATQYDVDGMFHVAEQFVSRPDVRFVFIGSGSQAGRVAQFNLPNVRRIDWIPHDAIPQAWAASTVTYWALRDAPLYHGTIPAKLYEALACGVPVAAAMEGEGARMIRVSGGGLTVPCGDTAGLAQIITRLLDDAELRAQCRRAGRAYAEAHFDPDTVATQYEDVLRAAFCGQIR